MTKITSILCSTRHYISPFKAVSTNQIYSFTGWEKCVTIVAGVAAGILMPGLANAAAFYVVSAVIKSLRLKNNEEYPSLSSDSTDSVNVPANKSQPTLNNPPVQVISTPLGAPTKISTVQSSGQGRTPSTSLSNNKTGPNTLNKPVNKIASSSSSSVKTPAKISKVQTSMMPSTSSTVAAAKTTMKTTHPFSNGNDPLLLAEIFSYLPQTSQFSAQKVCKSWQAAMPLIPPAVSQEMQTAYDNVKFLNDNNLLNRPTGTVCDYAFKIEVEMQEDTGEIIGCDLLRRTQTNKHKLSSNNQAPTRIYSFTIGLDCWASESNYRYNKDRTLHKEAISLEMPQGNAVYSDTIAKEMLCVMNYSANLKWHKAFNNFQPGKNKYGILSGWPMFELFAPPYDLNLLKSIREERLKEAERIKTAVLAQSHHQPYNSGKTAPWMLPKPGFLVKKPNKIVR